MSSKKRNRDTLEKGSSSTHDPACDQCRIKKIRCDRERPHCLNCSRLGHDCEWSGNGKRPSQMTGISHRLDQLEDSISEMRVALELVVSTTSASSLRAGSISQPSSLPSGSDEPSSCSPPPTPSVSTPSLFNQHAFQNAHGCQTYFPSTSLVSLIKAVDNVVLLPLCTENSDPQNPSDAATARDKLAALEKEHFEIPRLDGLNPSLPPLAMLESTLDQYFDAINPYFPIWTRECFSRLLDSVYEQQGSSEDRALIICFNNLVLLTLMTKSRQAHARNVRPSLNRRGTSSMDTDLMDSFMKNAKRAFENIEILLRPRLICVQALLSLCLIAQEYFSPGAFRMVFHSAIQVAKSIGLHHLDYTDTSSSLEERQEQMGVLCCLRILDKSVLWTAGWPICLPTSDVTAQLPTERPVAESEKYLFSKIRLSCIEEEAYLNLFSNQSRKEPAMRRSRSISKLNTALQGWLADHKAVVLDEAPLDNFLSCATAELAYSFYSTRLMVNWPTDKDHGAYTRFLSDARASINVLLRLWDATSELGHYSTLQRLVASYPSINIFALCVHNLTNDPVDDDLGLLRSLVLMFARMTESNDVASHNTQLYKVAEILVNLLPISAQRDGVAGSTSFSAMPTFANAQQKGGILSDQLIPYKPNIAEPATMIDFPGLFPSMEFEMPGFLDIYAPNDFALSPTTMQGSEL